MRLVELRNQMDVGYWLEVSTGATPVQGFMGAQKTVRQAELTDKQLDALRTTLLSHFEFTAVTQALSIPRAFISVAHPSAQYSAHVDWEQQSGVDVDLSFTVPLQLPVRGGELVFFTGEHLPQTIGAATVYPTHYVHEVLPVLAGTRIAIVGWVESKYKTSEARACAEALDRVTRATKRGSPEWLHACQAKALLARAVR